MHNAALQAIWWNKSWSWRWRWRWRLHMCAKHDGAKSSTIDVHACCYKRGLKSTRDSCSTRHSSND